MGISVRLQEERKRLALTQEAVAEKIGATKRSVINWEGGASLPGAEVLASLATIGADVLYILTGQRSAPLTREPALAPDEKIMLDNYRHAPDGVKSGVKTTLGAFAPGANQGSKRKAS